MEHKHEHKQPKQTFRVDGLTCPDCAQTFEQKVKALPGVLEARLNYAAAKLEIVGQVPFQELERTGATEGLKLIPAEGVRSGAAERTFSWRKWKSNAFMIISALFLVLGWWALIRYGENSVQSAALFLVSILFGGHTLLYKGLRNLSRFRFDMNTLMTIAVIGAAAIGEWWEGAVVVLLFAISEWLEGRSLERARASIRSLIDLAPKEAWVRRNGRDMRIPAKEIVQGDLVIVKPGEKIAADGLVERGHSAVNQAAITGESIPQAKQPGSPVYAGTLNGDGLLEIRATKSARDTTLAKVIELVEKAQSERAPAQKFVDQFARYYTPAIIAIAALIALVPPLVWDAAWMEWIYRGLAVLVVGCPCALVISTPVAIVTAIGNAARHGVMIKGGVYLEQAGRINAIAFDKTGTLTEGRPSVTDIIPIADVDTREGLAIAAAIEKGSGHPLAAAVVARAEQEHCQLPAAEQFRSITGRGAEALISGTIYRIGSPAWFAEFLADGLDEEVQIQIDRLRREGKTVMVLGTKTKALALIAVTDPVRDSTKQALAELEQLGIRHTVMLTGDDKTTAQAVAAQIGIRDVQANLMPEDKLEAIKQLKAKYGNVAMVGDGVNDAPALATADIGMAMGGAGTDTALETADIALMADDLSKLPYTLRLSRRALQVIRENIAFSIGLKILALLLIIPGWLTLWMAIFADMGATLIVTLNAMRLLRVRS